MRAWVLRSDEAMSRPFEHKKLAKAQIFTEAIALRPNHAQYYQAWGGVTKEAASRLLARGGRRVSQLVPNDERGTSPTRFW